MLVIRAASVRDGPRPAALPSASSAGASALEGRSRPPPLPSRRAGNAGLPRVVQASRDSREPGTALRPGLASTHGLVARSLRAAQGRPATRTPTLVPSRADAQVEAEEREWQAQLARAKAQAVEARAGGRERNDVEARAGGRERNNDAEERSWQMQLARAKAQAEMEERDWSALRARAEAAARHAEAAARSAQAAARSAQAAAQSAQAAACSAASMGTSGAVAYSIEREQREWAERIASARAGALGAREKTAHRAVVQAPRIVLWP